MCLDGTLKEEETEADHKTPSVVTLKHQLEILCPETETDVETSSVAHFPGREDRLKSSRQHTQQIKFIHNTNRSIRTGVLLPLW